MERLLVVEMFFSTNGLWTGTSFFAKVKYWTWLREAWQKHFFEGFDVEAVVGYLKGEAEAKELMRVIAVLKKQSRI